MPNNNYRSGRRKEYSVIDKLRKDYDIIQRTAGSHSPFDIIAINLEKRDIKLIQVKPKDLSEKDFIKICDENKKLNNSFRVTFKVM